MHNDTFYTNGYLAQVGGVSLENMNQLESYFMKMIDWNVNVSTEEFEFYEKNMEVAFGQQMTEVSPQHSSVDQQLHQGAPQTTN